MDDIRELTRRIEALETQNRRMKRLGGLLLVMAVAATLMAQSTPVLRDTVGSLPAASPLPADGKIRAEGFILTDDRGRERASLVADGAGSVFLIMFDKEGKARADLHVSNDGPNLSFYDASGKSRLIMGSTTLVGSHVVNNGMVEKNPPSSIVMFDSLGQFLWRTP